MNLLPSTEKEDLKKGLKIRWLIASSFLLAAVFLAGFILLLPSYFLTLGNFSKTGKESNSLNVKNEESLKSLLNLPSEINSKLSFLQSNTDDISVSDYIYKVIDFLPAGVRLDSVSFSRNQVYKEKNGSMVSVSGIAQSRDSLVSFSNILKESSLFSAVDIPVGSLTKDKNLPFSISIFIENKK